MDTEQRSPFFGTGELLFVWFIIILCCIVGYGVISVSKPAINNPLISKPFSCDFYTLVMLGNK